MTFAIDWHIFHQRYLNKSTIFVEEKDDRWVLYTYDERAPIMSEVMKSEKPEENIMFVERYLAGRSNLIKIMGVVKDEPEGVETTMKPAEQEMDGDMEEENGEEE